MARRRAFDLYPHNHSATLDPNLFRRPTAEYRGTPFWSWNTKLDVPQLLRQIDQFKEMGFGGFHMHARTGLATEYLGEEFMAAVRACTEKAEAESMLAWLYDEDRWPSGFAGGLVTKDKRFRTRHLLWTATPYQGAVAEACQDERAAGTRSENGTLLARYQVVLKDGRLFSYRRLKESEKPRSKGRIWYAYLETSQESSWFNHQTYVDTFSIEAIEKFLETTHERYAATVGKYFGGVVPAIFTDEPQFPKKTTFLTADELRDVIVPFTTDFAETYRKTYGQDLLDYLPELFWDLPGGKASVARYRYHDHTAERFAAAFGDTIGRWCERRGIALTGHMLGEATLFMQTRGIGESMRPLRSFQIPGIDMLCDRMELTTAKQTQSVAHQYGRPGVLSELYGVTNWDFDFVGHKAQGDWQAALGVTVRVPHLAWVSMAGESKRDYPAAIGYQSPWYKEYGLIEDHFARVNTVLSRGKPGVRAAVIHPVESYWLCFGPVEQNQLETEEREESFKNITSWLLFSLIDFDYVSEGLLPEQCPKQAARQFLVGQMKYEAVIVPSLRTIRATTLKRLEQFARAGGTVIFAGEVPSLVDAVPSAAPRRLAQRCQTVPFTRRRIVEAIEPFRDVELRHQDGSPANSILYQLRIDGKHRHLFLVNTDREKPRESATIRIHGKWEATRLDTLTGEMHTLPSGVEDGDTIIPWSFTAHGSLLITLAPRTKQAALPAEDAEPPTWTEIGRLSDPVPITLSEPNVLLLDQAQWRLDKGEWRELEEILRLDNKAREQLKLPMRAGRIAQPWTDTEPSPVVAQLQLKFAIRSEIDVESPQLAVEDAKSVQIRLDGKQVPNDVTGWWVDESIKTVALPRLPIGEHELILTIPFSRKANVEWCYLLGEFGVAVEGRYTRLIHPVRTLCFGDWTHQGLPFYAGNVTYQCTIQGTGRPTLIEATKFKNPLLSVNLDGKPAGKIAFAPVQVELGTLNGTHRLDLTAYGNRVNAFGSVHNADESLTWYGPGAWRHTGARWAYEYQLRRMGILVAPTIRVLE